MRFIAFLFLLAAGLPAASPFAVLPVHLNGNGNAVSCPNVLRTPSSRIVSSTSSSTSLSVSLARPLATLVAPHLPHGLESLLHIIFPSPTALEAILITRSLQAVCAGLIIGVERSLSDQPAGVRTMSLVSLGASLFTLCGSNGFSGRFDSSRLSAAVASGVGFIGAGVITTNAQRRPGLADRDAVHGMTTAAAIWVSAAAGVCCGCGLPFLGLTASLANVFIMRVGKGFDLWARNKYQRRYEEMALLWGSKAGEDWHNTKEHDSMAGNPQDEFKYAPFVKSVTKISDITGSSEIGEIPGGEEEGGRGDIKDLEAKIKEREKKIAAAAAEAAQPHPVVKISTDSLEEFSYEKRN